MMAMVVLGRDGDGDGDGGGGRAGPQEDVTLKHDSLPPRPVSVQLASTAESSR